MSTNRNINDIIVDKIHATFVELVPEDELREIVSKAIDDFKAPRVVQNGSFNREMKPSPLEEYVGKAIHDLLKKAVDQHINDVLKPKFDEEGKRLVSETITKAVADVAPVMMQAYVQNAGTFMTSMMISDLQNKLRQNGLNIW